MADNICIIPFGGVDYPLHPKDITVARLRTFKQKYGPEYGTYIGFTSLFLQGDADAVACAISIVLAKEGIKRDPNMIDFSPFEIFEAITKANQEKEEAEAERIANGEPEPEAGPTEAAPIPGGALT